MYILPLGWTNDTIKVMSRFLDTVWIWRRKRLSYNPRKIEKLWVWTNANSREILCFILNGVTSLWTELVCNLGALWNSHLLLKEQIAEGLFMPLSGWAITWNGRHYLLLFFLLSCLNWTLGCTRVHRAGLEEHSETIVYPECSCLNR